MMAVALPNNRMFNMPDRMVTELVFYTRLQVLIPTGSQSAAYRWRPTNAFDIDPTVGSTAAAGFTEFAAFYTSYRVLGSSIVVSTQNPSSTLAASMVVVPLNLDPTGTPSATVINSWASNSYGKHKLIGFSGALATTLKCSISTEKIYGSLTSRFDDNFIGLTSGSVAPANNWFWALGLIADGVLGSNLPISVETTIKIRCEFFDRKQLNT